MKKKINKRSGYPGAYAVHHKDVWPRRRCPTGYHAPAFNAIPFRQGKAGAIIGTRQSHPMALSRVKILNDRYLTEVQGNKRAGMAAACFLVVPPCT